MDVFVSYPQSLLSPCTTRQHSLAGSRASWHQACKAVESRVRPLLSSRGARSGLALRGANRLTCFVGRVGLEVEPGTSTNMVGWSEAGRVGLWLQTRGPWVRGTNVGIVATATPWGRWHREVPRAPWWWPRPCFPMGWVCRQPSSVPRAAGGQAGLDFELVVGRWHCEHGVWLFASLR